MRPQDARGRPISRRTRNVPALALETAGAGLLGLLVAVAAMTVYGSASPEPSAGFPPEVPAATTQGWDAMRGAGVEQIGMLRAGQEPTVHVDPTPNAQASMRTIKRASSIPATKSAVARTQVGWATWYSGTRGFLGRATVALPTSRYTGRISGYVRVCVLRSGRCARLPVVDCLCGHAPGVIVDLSRPALGRNYLRLDPRVGKYRLSVTKVP